MKAKVGYPCKLILSKFVFSFWNMHNINLWSCRRVSHARLFVRDVQCGSFPPQSSHLKICALGRRYDGADHSAIVRGYKRVFCHALAISKFDIVIFWKEQDHFQVLSNSLDMGSHTPHRTYLNTLFYKTLCIDRQITFTDKSICTPHVCTCTPHTSTEIYGGHNIELVVGEVMAWRPLKPFLHKVSIVLCAYFLKGWGRDCRLVLKKSYYQSVKSVKCHGETKEWFVFWNRTA